MSMRNVKKTFFILKFDWNIIASFDPEILSIAKYFSYISVSGNSADCYHRNNVIIILIFISKFIMQFQLIIMLDLEFTQTDYKC